MDYLKTMAHLQKRTVIVCNKYPNNLKMRVSVGIKSDLGKALIASNSGSIVKSITQYKSLLKLQPFGRFTGSLLSSLLLLKW